MSLKRVLTGNKEIPKDKNLTREGELTDKEKQLMEKLFEGLWNIDKDMGTNNLKEGAAGNLDPANYTLENKKIIESLKEKGFVTIQKNTVRITSKGVEFFKRECS